MVPSGGTREALDKVWCQKAAGDLFTWKGLLARRKPQPGLRPRTYR